MHGIWDRTLCYGQEHKLKKEYRLLQVADNLKVAIQPNKALTLLYLGEMRGVNMTPLPPQFEKSVAFTIFP